MQANQSAEPHPIEHPVCFVSIPEKLPPKNIFCNITVLSYCTPPPLLLAPSAPLVALPWDGVPANPSPLTPPDTLWLNRWTVTDWSHPRARFTPYPSHPNVTFSLWYQWDVIILLHRIHAICHRSVNCIFGVIFRRYLMKHDVSEVVFNKAGQVVWLGKSPLEKPSWRWALPE